VFPLERSSRSAPFFCGEQLENWDLARKAYDYALDLLSARAYTIRNLRRKLVQREYPADEVVAVVERLLGAGLLDDARYAREYARQKLTLGCVAVRRVELELARRGVGRDEIARAVAVVLEEEPVDLERSVNAAARKKIALMGGLAPDVKRRRLFAYLARRGFEAGEIRRSIEQNLADAGR